MPPRGRTSSHLLRHRHPSERDQLKKCKGLKRPEKLAHRAQLHLFDFGCARPPLEVLKRTVGDGRHGTAIFLVLRSVPRRLNPRCRGGVSTIYQKREVVQRYHMLRRLRNLAIEFIAEYTGV